MAESLRLFPIDPEAAYGLTPIPPVPGVTVRLAPVRVAVGIAATRGSAGLADALQAVLDHRIDGEPGGCAGDDPRSIWTAPDRWLVTSDRQDRFAFVEAIEVAAAGAALVTDVTDGLPALDLVGPAVKSLLAHGGSTRVSDNGSARTLLALQPVTLAARGDAIRLFVDRSLLPYLWNWIARHALLATEGTR